MMRNLVNGAVGGALATAVYSAMLMAADRAGVLEEPPPRRFARLTFPGREKPRRGENVLGTIAHFAFGSSCGSVLGLLSAGQRVPVPIGTAYGLLVWYFGCQGMAPSIGVHPPVPKDRVGRQAALLAGHLLWGTALALALNRLRTTEKALTAELTPRVREQVRRVMPAPQPVSAR
ncbi:DUF6789 family protein [Microbispora sp. H11081]|uniref:DUF6789 family protein n=1 Tax=Microbispora sp. H11081 TaxID=2729107 RepID=UPI001472E606|nr:DUF6789 family protein [Microbispora sp. H11081]